MSFTLEFTENYTEYYKPGHEGRYLRFQDIEKELDTYSGWLTKEFRGESVEGRPIYIYRCGTGNLKLLMWSQMHGNESTTTRALMDLLHFMASNDSFREFVLKNLTLEIIPVLNPDGATAYTRVNHNKVDLNRDAQDLSQPESRVLSEVFAAFEPDFCFNLHDQRTIFSAGKYQHPATVSFLSPAKDEERSVNVVRMASMQLIVAMNEVLQPLIPGQVGRYDDSFNINCVGDTFQSAGVPTVLFESGHYPHDYKRLKTRMYIAIALVRALEVLANEELERFDYEEYFMIPENDKLFLDVIVRNTTISEGEKELAADLGILYKETLVNGDIDFVPALEDYGDLSAKFGHIELNAQGAVVDITKIDQNESLEIRDLLQRFS
ncbi:M14 family metallopeptidase [Robertkochia solimangrovi]|uniref:M14 family metallopeptidase n=1 Tax=Robertkochia solimangrovi TaxID=2213046 RepID=UPI0011808108|nr:M14 metallopeptidase family protein [Robertkochia solimangrovi]TRZ45311.1 peptidase M14 [Robertkochia solimangrovi]